MLNAYHEFTIDIKDKTAMLVPKYIERAFLGDENWGYEVNYENNVQEVITAITSGNIVKTEIFEKVGLFDENLFIDYVNHEFCLRIRKHGYKIFSIQSVYLLHRLGDQKHGNFLGKNVTYTNHSSIRRYYITRNRIYVWTKYLSVEPKWVIKDFIGSIKEVIKIILYETDKVLKIKMIVKGILDAITHNYGKLKLKNEVLK
jgi:rhamnosyltransferase